MLGERTRQLWRDNSRRVRTHEKNSGDAVRRLATIIQRIFCAQSGTSTLLAVWNGPVRVGTQGLFRPCLKTFVAPLSPAWLTAPGSPRMLNTSKILGGGTTSHRVTQQQLSITWEQLKISRWPFHSSTILEAYLLNSLRFLKFNFHISLPELGFFSWKK